MKTGNWEQWKWLEDNQHYGEVVLSILRHMKVVKSHGPDQLYPRALWEAREEIANALAEIYESTLDISEKIG